MCTTMTQNLKSKMDHIMQHLEYPHTTVNNPMDASYAVIGMDNLGEDWQMKEDVENFENPPNPQEVNGKEEFEDMYTASRIQLMECICYDTAAIRNGHTIEYEEISPQRAIPSHS